MKVVVLGGGLSTERNVSIVSSVSICKALREIGHKAIFVDLFLGIEKDSDKLEALFDSECGLCDTVEMSFDAPDIEAVKRKRNYRSDSRIGKNVLEICKLADCVFLGLHGKDGEDGKIQACLEMLGIPYTGSDYLSSAIAMDKSLARTIMQANGIQVPPLADSIPCVVKCAHGGSSIGTYICETDEELTFALEDIKKYNDVYFIEKKISGAEFSVPVFNDKALCPIEIIPPDSGKFDYAAKYQAGSKGATEICPARLDRDATEKLQQIAEKIHKKMNLSFYSRSDFIMDEDGDFWCLEVNTLPGMTPSSLLPKAAKESKIEYSELCEQILLSSKNKHTF